MAYRFQLVVCGGTFDLLHEGHKSFLRFILHVSEKVILGLTSDKYVSLHKSGQEIAPFATRKRDLLHFFATEHVSERVQIISIDDAFGPAIDPSFAFDGIVVTINTIKGGDAINTKRKEIRLSQLPLIIAPLQKDKSNKIISSTEIRKGSISQKGESYFFDKWKGQYRMLPQTIRQQLAQPLGSILQNIDREKILPEKIVTVGDVTTQKFLSQNIIPKIAVIDFMIGRKKTENSQQSITFFKEENIFHAFSPASVVSPSLWQAVEKSIARQENSLIIINGEEDLSVIPLVLLLPLNFVVYYGQPHTGLVQVVITPDIKLTVANIFRNFSLIATRGH